MKMLPIFLFLLFNIGMLQAQEPPEFSKTEQAIIKVIKQETDAWWTRDYKAWSDAWAHTDYIRWSGTTNLSHQEHDSWNELSKFVQQSFEDYPDPDAAPVIRTDWQIQVYKNAAWVRYVQDAYGITKETRILEKKGGKWKLVYVGWINETSYEQEETTSEEK